MLQNWKWSRSHSECHVQILQPCCQDQSGASLSLLQLAGLPLFSPASVLSLQVPQHFEQVLPAWIETLSTDPRGLPYAG